MQGLSIDTVCLETSTTAVIPSTGPMATATESPTTCNDNSADISLKNKSNKSVLRNIGSIIERSVDDEIIADDGNDNDIKK